MTDHTAAVELLRQRARHAERIGAEAPSQSDREFCRQKAAEFTAAATALECLSGQHAPTRTALADRNPAPSDALDRMLADRAQRDHEIDNAIDAKRDAWDRTGGDIVLTNPECRSDKHSSCDGRGWNESRDEYTTCPCPCHRATQRGGTW